MKKEYIKPEIEIIEMDTPESILESSVYDVWKDDEEGEIEIEGDNRSKDYIGSPWDEWE